MIISSNIRWFYILCGIFLLLNTYYIVQEFYLIALVPIILVVIWLGLFRLNQILLLTAFTLPLAINLEDLNVGFGISLPTEPLMVGAMFLFLMKCFWQGFDSRIIKHPITKIMIIGLVWTFFTSVTSSMPLVSFKFLLAKFWFISSFYFLGTQLFKDWKNVDRFMWVSIIPLTGVIIYTVVRMAGYGFDKDAAHWVMQPFYKDHGVYATVLALFIPVLVGWMKTKSKFTWLAVFALLIVYSVGMVLSYTRASWLGLVAAFGVFMLMYMRIKFSTIATLFVVIIGLFFASKDYIFIQLEKNKQDSSTDLAEHVESISNVASDASNMERINRWNSALRMFAERPIVGWGPGTYSFQYAPFQHSSERTIISTNFGDGGNAHSEFLGPMAEQGVLGALLFIALMVVVLHRAIKLYFQLHNPNKRVLLLTVTLGLVTYFVHGVLNNFLDSDKAAVPFWAFTAIIVAIDVYHRDGERKCLDKSAAE